MIYLICFIVWNIFVFFLYGTDKLLAKKRKHRIRESTLILLSYLFASLGAMLGMIVFNHKTSKVKFRVLIPLSFIFNIICALVFCKFNQVI
ncbi:MAG: DUF1294 domain-containing protein [Clostridia bacterium]